MLTEIIVTNATLVLDGRTIMPGSRLLIKGEPHKGWSGAIKIGGEVTEQRLVVASPSIAAEPAPKRGRQAHKSQDAE